MLNCMVWCGVMKALSHASSKGHLKCVHKLLQLGADPTIYTYDYLYPFDLAQNSGHNEVRSYDHI